MSQSDAHNQANGRRGNPGADPSEWMTLDDEALARAVDGAFGGTGGAAGGVAGGGTANGERNGALGSEESSDANVDSLLAFGAACRAALAIAPSGEGTAPLAESIPAQGTSPSESERLRERRVVARILAKTTRRERETRVLDFVSEKLRRSSLLRVAAAILVVQVTVVPLIAWHLAKLPVKDGFMTGIEPAPEIFEQDLPRLREPIEEVETRHDELMGIGGSLSAALAGVEIEGMDLQQAATADSLDQALLHLARVARDPLSALDPAALHSMGSSASMRSNAIGPQGQPSEPDTSRGLLIQSLDLEARLMAFENARRSEGLSLSIQRLSAGLESAHLSAAASPAALALAVQALERAQGLNLAVPDGPAGTIGPASIGSASIGSGSKNDGLGWFELLDKALLAEGAQSPSATIDAWLTAIRAR